eukprot:SM000013S26390  [mRNA]  locus=s13:129169:129936:- [translate_table: standard]
MELELRGAASRDAPPLPSRPPAPLPPPWRQSTGPPQAPQHRRLSGLPPPSAVPRGAQERRSFAATPALGPPPSAAPKATTAAGLPGGSEDGPAKPARRRINAEILHREVRLVTSAGSSPSSASVPDPATLPASTRRGARNCWHGVEQSL